MARRPDIVCRIPFDPRRARAGVLGPLLVSFLLMGHALVLVKDAGAADPVDVESMIRQGVDLRKKGKDQQALVYFKRAYDLERSPRTAAQLGLAQLAMGYVLPAEQHLAEALASPNHLWVVRNRAQIQAAHAQAMGSIGQIDITGTPTGAEIIVNGKPAGQLPIDKPLRVAEGLVQIVVRAPGFEESVTNTHVRGGGRDAMMIALSRTRPLDAVPPGLAANAGAVAENGARGGESGAVRDSSARAVSRGAGAPRWVRPAAWVAASFAVGALGIGGYGLVRLQQRESAFNERVLDGTSSRACSASAPGRGARGCAQTYAEVQSAQSTARIALPAAGALAAAAIVGLLWSAGNGGSAADAAALRPSLVASFDGDVGTGGWLVHF